MKQHGPDELEPDHPPDQSTSCGQELRPVARLKTTDTGPLETSHQFDGGQPIGQADAEARQEDRRG